MSVTTPRASDTYRRLLRYVRPHWQRFAYAILGMVGFALTDIAFAALLQPMLDGSFTQRDSDSIWFVPLAIVVLFLIRGAAGYASTYFMAWIGWAVIKQLRAEVFQKYLTLPTAFYDEASSGELISRITFNSQKVATAASTALTVFIRDTLTAVGLLALMFWHSWQLSLCFLVIGPIIGVIVGRVTKQFRKASRNIQESMGDVSHVIQEAIDGSRVVKIFGGQDGERLRFESANESNRRFNMRETRIRALNVPIIQLLVAIALAIIVFVASSDVLGDDRLSPGEFMSFIGAMLLLFAPMRRLTMLNSQIQQGIAAGESLFETLDLESETDTGTQSLTAPIASIEYRDVSMAYREDKPAVLKNVTLNIRSGDTIALVGESGSGKTSLISLLARMYDYNSGDILINGTSVQEFTLVSLRSQISYVSQDVMLFNDTILNNIAYGSSEAVDRPIIEAACKAAFAADFIEKLDDGYETMVGENGIMLSGGQRQRVAIARALLKDAPILILDEATSALDNESERKVQEGLDNLMHGRTTLVVAHRLSTIVNADCIVVMKQGQIVESGTHGELLGKNSHYSKLHQLQFS